jgi:trimeric autotransporter adhesin
MSEFTDPVANPMIRSWKYKISAVDNCGNESEHSSRHKTLHLTINKGLGSSINLIWSHHEGFALDTYHIIRYVNGAEQRIDSISSEDNTYTDLTPPAGDLFYQIEVRHPSGCEATRAKNYNSSRSNVSSKAPNEGSGGGNYPDPGSVGTHAGIRSLQLYPNPAKDNLNIIIEKEDRLSAEIMIYDLHGRLVYQTSSAADSGFVHENVNIANFSSGVYQFRIVTEKGVMNRKVVISR